MEEVVKYLRALLAVQLRSQVDDSGKVAQVRPEILLALFEAGLTHNDIAKLSGKKPAAVAKAVSRLRAALKIEDEQEGEVE